MRTDRVDRNVVVWKARCTLVACRIRWPKLPRCASRQLRFVVVSAWLLGTALQGTAIGLAAEDVAAEPVNLVRAAARAARDNVKSGKGRGVVRRFEGPVESLSMEAQFHLVFDSVKYHIALDFKAVEGKAPMYERIVAVCDGDTLATAMFSDRIKPSGCSIEIHEPGTAIRGATKAVDCSPYCMPKLLARKMILDRDLKCEEVEDGAMRLSMIWDSGGQTDFEANAAHGYNIVRVNDWGKGDDGVTYRTVQTGEWDHDGTVWFLRRLTDEKLEDGTLVGRWEFTYEDFEANVAVSDEEFRWAKLPSCADGVVVDQRPGARVRAYRNEVSSRTTEHKLDTLIERVQALQPVSSRPSEKPPRARGSSRRKWLILSGLVGVGCLLGAGVLARRRAKRA